MGPKEWFEVAKLLVFGFLLGCASWFIWIAILDSKPTRKHLYRHLAALALSAALVGMYFQSRFGVNGVLWVFGVYWLVTAIPAIPRIRFNKDGVANSSAIALSKVLLFLAVLLFTDHPEEMWWFIAVAWSLVFAMQGLAKKDAPAGPQVRPVTNSEAG